MVNSGPVAQDDSLLVRPRADEEGTAHSRDVAIAWRRYGSGSATVLVMPTWNFVDSRVVRRQIDGLRDRFRVIAFDPRGSGESGRPTEGYGFGDHAADAVAVLDATGTPSAALVAASRGSHSAVLLATRQPERVQKLVLIAPAIDVPTDTQTAREETEGAEGSEPSWRTDYANFVPWFIERCFPEPGSERTIADISAIALEADHRMLLQEADEEDWDEAPRQLQDVTCPTLVIHGVDDVFVDPELHRHVVLCCVPGVGFEPTTSAL